MLLGLNLFPHHDACWICWRQTETAQLREAYGKTEMGCGLAQVFEPKEWAALMGKSILPKLAYCLDSEFAVNPVDQQLEAWEWAMSWAPVLPR